MAFKIIINQSQIRDKIFRYSYPKANSIGTEKARKIANTRKDRFLSEFKNHEVSKEIQAGASKSGEVDGVKGNLFSFIGFEDGETPVEDLIYYFEQAISLTNRKGVYNNQNRTFTYTMRGPTEEGMKKVTDMSNYAQSNNNTKFGYGISWVRMVEDGIPGLGYYKFGDQKTLGGESRSGTGLQRKNEIHPGAVHGGSKDYLTELLQILAGDNN